ncbi:MAG: biopolymer transporter ExbD [Flavobacteriales bacterium]|nr:biopolymer transporter ExbD [Flavobacteriales bacterium]
MARKKRELQEINAGSMADIAFLLLVFFLVTTTMDTSWGLARKLPPPLLENQPDPPPIKDRNVFVVLANANDQLLVEGELLEIGELRAAAKDFIANPQRKENLPEFRTEDIPLLGMTQVSKQVISLQNDNGTSYDLYIQVQNELAAAYTELRNELASREFGMSYLKIEEMAKSQQGGEKFKAMMDAIRDVYPQRISEAEPKDIGG